jgi:hypothetical protein
LEKRKRKGPEPLDARPAAPAGDEADGPGPAQASALLGAKIRGEVRGSTAEGGRGRAEEKKI